MVMGVGVDLLSIERMEREIARNGGGFTDSVFTDAEIARCASEARPADAFAVCFAAKEALIKALGGAQVEGFRWRDLEIIRSPDGAYTATLHGAVRQLAESMKVRRIRLSLSTAGGTAAALAVLES